MRRRHWAGWLVAATLLMRLLIPAGYMPVASGGSIVLELCSSYGPEPMAAAMPAMTGHDGHHDHSHRSEMPCGFAGLTLPALAAADPILLAIAAAHVVATAFRVAIVSRAGPPAFLRPPSRGPPARR